MCRDVASARGGHLGIKTTILEIMIVGAYFEPNAAGRVEDRRHRPGVYVDFGRVLSDGVNKCCDPKFRMLSLQSISMKVRPILMGTMGTLGLNGAFSPWLGPRANLHRVE